MSDDEFGDEQPEPGPVSRDAYEKAVADAKAGKAAKKELEQLQAQMEQLQKAQRETEAKALFNQAGYPETAAARFLKYEPDAELTEETITAWAGDLGIQPRQAEQPAPNSFLPFTPTPSGGPPEQTKMSREDFDYLMRTNPAKALSMDPSQVAWRHKGTEETLREMPRR